MLACAARRKARFRLNPLLVASFEQLELPWLCPAVARCLVQQARRSSSQPSIQSPTRRKLQKRTLSSERQPIRQLATATDGGPRQFNLHDDYLPFEGVPSRGPDDQEHEWSTSHLLRFNPLDRDHLLMLPTEFDYSSPVFRKARRSMSGDLAELQQSLYACVRVGRYDRAAAIVRRIAVLYEADSAELLDAHHQHMMGLLDSLAAEPTKQRFVEIQKWFELDVRGRGVPPTPPIIAIVIKASLLALNGSRLERTIRRYLNVAHQHSVDLEADVLASSIFTDAEFDMIVGLFPTRFDTSQIPIPDLTGPAPAPLSIDAGSAPTVAPVSESGLPSFPGSSVPEPMAVDQKGLGLAALKQSLSSMYDQERRNASALEQQENLELDVLNSALERWKKDAEHIQQFRSQHQLSNYRLGSHVWKWVQEMSQMVREETARAQKLEGEKEMSLEDAEKLLIAPFLKFVSPEKLCTATVLGYVNELSIKKKSGISNEVSMLSMVSSIGSSIAKEIRLESVQDRLRNSRFSTSAKRRQKLSALLRHNRGATVIPQETTDVASETENQGLELTGTLKSKIGAFFLSIFMKVATLPVTAQDPVSGKKVTQVQPVAVHAYKWYSGKVVGVVKTNQELISRLKEEPVASFISKHLPMLVEPRSWNESESGPYLHTPIKSVRFKDFSRSQQEYISVATKRGDMAQVLNGVDVIGKVPWRINRDLFRVMVDAWNTGEAIGGLALANPKLEFPTEPDPSDKVAHTRWRFVVRAVENEVAGMHSERCYQNFQLEVARAFLDHTFYTPHNLDFRGRAYPIPPYFNHMGADHVRGLFLFAAGKELGQIGLQWLKIHLANKYGYDKESLKDREQFAMDHLNDIYDSAVDPLNGRRWWLTADDPWQCLAACMELKAALDSPNPTKFVSHLPVHQDGTCNGLQHYAALGGDSIGAKQVNLLPGDRPADIYSAVADLVRDDIREQAANGDKEAQVLEGKITRKVVKQPVMTNVYGVTFYGAKAQVRKQLVEIMPKATLENDINLSSLSTKIARAIFAALSKMFNGAQAIQLWLGECGARISHAVTPEQIERILQTRAGQAIREEARKKAKEKQRRKTSFEREASKEDYQFKSTIVWTTPLGMPVVQPYREAKYRIIDTNLQQLKIPDSRLSDPVHKRRQLQAFPPNFIHSLDATHMLLSALKCNEIGLTFSSVHDSFWTHASDVPVMNRVLRDAFVRMHTEDIIGRLREEFYVRYKGCLQYASVHATSEVGKKIHKLRRQRGTQQGFSSPKVQNVNQVNELLEEYERQRLIHSNDPVERQKGYDMVTPCSIFTAGEDSSSPALLPNTSSLSNAEQSEQKEHNEDVDAARSETKQGVQKSSNGTASTEGDTNTSKAAGDTSKKYRSPNYKTHLWIPLSFPPAPAKGDFDVGTLKDSKYFFS